MRRDMQLKQFYKIGKTMAISSSNELRLFLKITGSGSILGS